MNRISTTILFLGSFSPIPRGIAQPPIAFDPFQAAMRRYLPPDFKRSVPEGPLTLIKDVGQVVPAILDALELASASKPLAADKGRYSDQFRVKVSEDETTSRYRFISMGVESYPTYREAELALARDLAGLPVAFEKCSGSIATVGELCYYSSDSSSKRIRFLRKNLVFGISISYWQVGKGAGPARYISESNGNDSSAICEEAARKIDEILIRYVPPVAP